MAYAEVQYLAGLTASRPQERKRAFRGHKKQRTQLVRFDRLGKLHFIDPSLMSPAAWSAGRLAGHNAAKKEKLSQKN
jgi:hypothetical protein